MKCYLCYGDINDDYYYQSDYKDMPLHFHISCLPNFTIKNNNDDINKLPICEICKKELNFNNIQTKKDDNGILHYFCNSCYKIAIHLHILFAVVDKIDEITKNKNKENECIFCNNIDYTKTLDVFTATNGIKWYYHKECIR